MTYYVRAQRVPGSPGPNQVLVLVETTSGQSEEVIVDKANLHGDQLEVGPIRTSQDAVLVELPNESVRGVWRLWVPSGLFKKEAVTAA